MNSGTVVIVLPAELVVVRVTGRVRENGLPDEEVAGPVTPLERSEKGRVRRGEEAA